MVESIDTPVAFNCSLRHRMCNFSNFSWRTNWSRVRQFNPTQFKTNQVKSSQVKPNQIKSSQIKSTFELIWESISTSTWAGTSWVCKVKLFYWYWCAFLPRGTPWKISDDWSEGADSTGMYISSRKCWGQRANHDREISKNGPLEYTTKQLEIAEWLKIIALLLGKMPPHALERVWKA